MTGLCRSGKTAYPDEETAVEALAAIREENEWTSRKTPCRAYRCDRCGEWHLTSQAARHS